MLIRRIFITLRVFFKLVFETYAVVTSLDKRYFALHFYYRAVTYFIPKMREEKEIFCFIEIVPSAHFVKI